MKVFRSLDAAALPASTRPRAATIGCFDGLHRGHQHLLGELKAWARQTAAAPAVVTFDPHPLKVLTGRAPPAVLSLEHRLLLLHRLGIESALVLAFDEALSRWPAEDFVARVLVQGLGARRLLLGFDSSIGYQRKGTFEYLSERAGALGIEVRQGRPFLLDGTRISSTLVRQAVHHGDLARVQELTGRPHALLGRVAAGEGRGRRLGFPTANLECAAELLPPRGVYFGRARLLREREWEAAATDAAPALPALVNIGVRPTFSSGGAAGDVQPVIEAHLIDFSGDLYGRIVELELVKWQRPERRFSGADELRAQIERDLRAYHEWEASLADVLPSPST
jgi:riboflavin kinase/FMN adenylyltransferase